MINVEDNVVFRFLFRFRFLFQFSFSDSESVDFCELFHDFSETKNAAALAEKSQINSYLIKQSYYRYCCKSDIAIFSPAFIVTGNHSLIKLFKIKTVLLANDSRLVIKEMSLNVDDLFLEVKELSLCHEF